MTRQEHLRLKLPTITSERRGIHDHA
jgi:hypothetical protein